MTADDLHRYATAISTITALLWFASGYFWVTSAKASYEKIYASPMAPGRPAVSPDWLAEFRRIQTKVQEENALAAGCAAAAAFMGMTSAIIGLV